MAKHAANTLSIVEICRRPKSDAVTWFELVRWNRIPTCPHCDRTEQFLNRTTGRSRINLVHAVSARFTVRMGTEESSRILLPKSD